LIDDLFALSGGGTQSLMANLVESGKLSMEDVKQAEKALRKLSK
jgi:BlaI family transcriptional regulator, penicillinase repressor